MSGFICIYALNVTTGNGSWDTSTCPYTLPEEYCPSISTTAPVVTGNGGSWTGYISVSTNGKIVLGNYGNGGSSDKRRGFLMYPISMQYSVSQHETDVISKLKFGIDKITFWENANGNFEIQFKTSKDNIFLFFSRNMVGVYDANTRTIKTVNLSQHSVSHDDTLVLYNESGQYVRIHRVGHMCVLTWAISQSTATYWAIDNIIPEGLRPDQTIYTPSCVTNANGYIFNVCAYCYIHYNGTIGFQVAAATSGAINRGVCSWYIN